MRRFLRLLLQDQMRSSPSPINPKEKGMTLVELLVGTIIAFIIMTPLMGMVIGLLNDDQKEGAKATTEQEIQAALDYISEDVSQALYIYDPNKETTVSGTTTTINEVDQIKAFLPNTTTETPVLVFWKRRIAEDSAPVNSSLQTTQCKQKPYQPGETRNCNDSYVLSLVSYHLLPETNKTSIWCQPSNPNSTCPSRIIRYEIYDGLKKANGSYYKVAELPIKLQEYGEEKIKAYNTTFNLSKPLEKVTNQANFPQGQVLVNYIEDFKLDNTSTNNLAKINMTANSARRIDSNPASCINKSSPYCVQSSVQVRGLSNLGTSE